MKNRELIKTLLDLNMDADVCIQGQYNETDVGIGYLDDGGEYTEKNTPIVFIDGIDHCE